MSGDRADRLSKRRQERSGTERNASDRDNTENTRNTDNADNTDKTQDETTGPLEETTENQMMRLTKDQYREMHHVYQRLKADYEYEFDEEFELNRHFFPLVLDHALDKLRECDANGIREQLEAME